MILHSVRILLGIFLIASSLAKLYPVEPFEYLLVEKGLSSWVFSPILARLIIGSELMLGLLLILNFKLRQITIKLVILMLAIYTGYLIINFVDHGNEENCGCFGTLIPMSTGASIVKNIGLIVVSLLLYFKNPSYKFIGKRRLIPIAAVLIAFTIPFLLKFLPVLPKKALEVNEHIDYSILPGLYGSGEIIDFNDGEKLVAFLSFDCDHCKNVARKLNIITKRKNVPEVYLVLAGKEEQIDEFLNATNTKFPFIHYPNKNIFILAGGTIPSLIYLKQGTIKNVWRGDTFDGNEIEELGVEGE